MPALSLRNIRKSFGSASILRDISLDIDEGEFIALVGPSGCGKSTLLRIIAGLEAEDSGDIDLAGRRINHAAPRDRDIAMVFQNYALYPHMTVAQNLGFSLKLAGHKPADISRRVKEAAQPLGLASLLDRHPRQLSGGQRQRVAMGRAIVRNPRAFLFDEPLSNLDAKLRVQMRTEIKALHQRLGTTTIYVTHDQVEAMTMADRIVVLKDGVVEQAGTPLALYDRPENAFVAGFVGSPAMNFIVGKLQINGQSRFVADDGTTLPLGPLPSALDGGSVLYGIRPEHFAIGGEQGVDSRVVVVEPTGSETHIAVRFADHDVIAAFRERIDARPGERLKLMPRQEYVHLFDAQSGMRLN